MLGTRQIHSSDQILSVFSLNLHHKVCLQTVIFILLFMFNKKVKLASTCGCVTLPHLSVPLICSLLYLQGDHLTQMSNPPFPNPSTLSYVPFIAYIFIQQVIGLSLLTHLVSFCNKSERNFPCCLGVVLSATSLKLT